MNGYLSIFQGILSTEYNQLDIYLDGLEDHQGFCAKTGDTDEVVQNISSLLTKTTTRGLGLRLLNRFLDQCGIEVFERRSNLWTTLVLKACNIQELQSLSVLTYEVLGKLASKCSQIPDLSKSFASIHLPKVYESLNKVPISCVKYALRCVETCLRLYAGSSGPSRGIIERFLWKFLDTMDNEVIIICGKCLQLLQQVRGGGVQGVNHKIQWKNYQIQLLGSIHSMFNELFKKCTEIYDGNIVEDQFILTSNHLEYENEPVKRAAQLYTRCHNLINFLVISLREPYPVAKPIQLKKILNVVCRGLSVTCIMLEQNPSADNFAIGLLMPKLHIDLLELLNTVIKIMRGYLRSHSQLILGLLSDTLKWTSSKNSYSNQKPLLNLRAKAYDSIALWCKILQSGSRCDSIAELLCNEIINDVTPIQSEFTLKVLSGARKHMSKKARRQLHKAQNEQSNLAQTHSNDNIRKECFSEEKNQILCVSALRCLQEVLLSGANFMKPTTIKLIHTHITQICAIFYELSMKPTHLYHNYECRMEIYNSLFVMLMTPHHLCPPPTEVVLTIIQTAHIRDDSLKVRSRCGFLLQNLEKIIHPQKESLLFLIEARDVRNTFIKLGQESLLNASAIDFSNTNSNDSGDDDIVDEKFEEKTITDQQDNAQRDEEIYDLVNDDTDTSINVEKTDIDDIDKRISEECQLENSELEDPPKSPEIVLRVDDEADIAATSNGTTDYDLCLNEPETKRPKLQDEDTNSCKLDMPERSVVLHSNSDGSENTINVDDDTLLADIASQFVDELN